jgi:catechol 2,3-dioxygenase-like lactoylglutathione lyase family enzyme
MYSKAINTLWLLLFYATTISAQTQSSANEIRSDSTFRPYLIAIVVPNVERTSDWYKEKLNFDLAKRLDFPQNDSLKIVIMKRGEVELELIQKKTSISIKKFVPDFDGFDKVLLIGFAKIAFWVNDANALAIKLKSKNVKFLVNLYEDKNFGLKSFIIEDLDGNVLQFNQRL